MRNSVLLVLSLLGFCSGALAASNGKVDQLDPIYENGTLPNNYYVQEKTDDSIVFANERVPNMFITVKFQPINERQMYELIADYMFRTVHADSVNSCQNSSFYKNFSSIEFECVKNQDSFVQSIFTQFEDQNNQPSEFYRIVTISYKTGDSPASDDVGEMINYANYNLGFFNNLNIPQKTILNHHTDPEFNNIDIIQMQELDKENENLWARHFGSTPVDVEGTDITDKGMKFFLKTKDTNEKFIATMMLSSFQTEGVVKQILEVIPNNFHNCKGTKEQPGVEVSSIKTECDEGNIMINIRQLPLRKYEYFVYEITSGSEELLEKIFADPTLSKQLSTYLYKTFYDKEMLNKKNNVLEYILGVDSGTQQSAPISFVMDNSTAKSLAHGPVDKNVKPETDPNTKTLIQETTSSNDGDSIYTIIAGATGICALVILLIIVAKRRKLDEEAKAEKARIKEEKARKKAEEDAKKAQATNEGELLAEIAAAQIEKEKQQRKIYQQKRDAEELAKKLEEKLKEGGEEELNRRRAALDKFNQTPEAVAAALSQPKTADSQANIEARNQVKNNMSDDALLADPKDETSTDSKKNTEKKATDKKSKESKASAGNSKETAKNKKIWTNNAGADSVVTEEEQARKEEELREAEEKKRKDQEFKFKGDSLLMKMRKDRDANPEDREEPVKAPAPEVSKVSSKPSMKFSLVGDKNKKNDKSPIVEEKAPVEDVAPTASQESIFGDEDMVKPMSDVEVKEQAPETPKGSIFGEDDMVAPVTSGTPKGSIFGDDDMVKPSSEVKVQELVEEVKPQQSEAKVVEEKTETIKNSIFGEDEMVAPVAEVAPQVEEKVAEQDKPVEDSAPKKKAKNPFDALIVNKSKSLKVKRRTEPEPEPEIDLEGQLNDEIDLNLFANNKDEPSSYDSEKILDLTPSDEMVLDLSSENSIDLTDTSFDSDFGSTSLDKNTSSERKNFFGSNEVEAAPASVQTETEAPAPEKAPKKKTSKRIRKFNLNSISTSLSDNN